MMGKGRCWVREGKLEKDEEVLIVSLRNLDFFYLVDRELWIILSRMGKSEGFVVIGYFFDFIEDGVRRDI